MRENKAAGMGREYPRRIFKASKGDEIVTERVSNMEVTFELRELLGDDKKIYGKERPCVEQ